MLRAKIPLRRSESFPNFAAARAAAIWGGARRRRPAGPEGGWGRRGEGRVGAPTQPPTPFGQRGPVQCKARAQPPPGVAGSGFGSQFKILNPKRCTDPKMANGLGLPRKKLSGSVIGRPEKFTGRPKSGQIPLDFCAKQIFGSGSTDPKMCKPPRPRRKNIVLEVFGPTPKKPNLGKPLKTS